MAPLKLSLVIVVATTSLAAADCPTNVRQLPLTGLLANAVPATGATEPDQRPAVDVELGAAGGMRAETDVISGTAALSGQVTTHRKGLTGCASAEVIDVRDTAARVTASAQVPLGFTGAAVGLSLERNVRVPLALRAEFFRVPVSRMSALMSLAFFDYDHTTVDKRLRVLILPITGELGLTTQDDMMVLDRRTTRREGALVRGSTTKGTRTTEISVLGVDAEANVSRTQPATAADSSIGFIRISPLAFARRGHARLSFELDGGVLTLAGPVDCDALRCERGFYAVALRRDWSTFWVEARAERTGFLNPLAVPMVEDRVSATGSLERRRHRAETSVFAAHTESFVGASATRAAGTRLLLSHRIAGDVRALLDGELVRSSDVQARLLVSLAWHKRTTRAHSTRR